MRDFACTYPQLMNQALARGWNADSLQKLRAAYELALRRFDGFYRGQGIPFICHLVRTASIVLAEDQPAEAVFAALLHSAYMFNLCRNECERKARQRELKREVGGAAESLISQYTKFPWRQAGAVRTHLENLETASALSRQILAIRLANELEDHLDLSMAYRGSFPYREWIETQKDFLGELARRLGMPVLAQELGEAMQEHMSASLPAVLLRYQRDAYELPEHIRLRKGFLGRAFSRLKRYLFFKKATD